MNIHVWVPDYASAIGGIQTFSRFLVRGLRDIVPDSRITVLAKNDTSYPESSAEWNVFIPMGWWPYSLRTAALSLELFRRASLERPSLIVTTHVNFAPVAFGLQKLFGTQCLAIGHGIEVWEVRDHKLRRALRKAAKLVAVSDFTKLRMASALGISPTTISLLPNTFDPEKFTPGPKPRFLLKRYGLRVDQPLIVTIARLASAERYKGYDQVLRALPAIRDRFPDVRYILGGRGPDRARIEAMIAELGLSGNVILAGYVPDHELREHYNLCDVFAMPSKGEGFGIVFLEAMACGKPVLAGNKDGSVDAVLNGEIGALVDPDDVQEIAKTLIAILERQKAERLKAEKLTSNAEGGMRTPEDRQKAAKLKTDQPKSNTPISDLRSPSSAVHLPDILFDPEALRARVIEAYGYERFKQRLVAILEPLLKS